MKKGTLSEILLSVTAGSTIYEQLGNFLFTGKGWLLSSHESGNEKKKWLYHTEKKVFPEERRQSTAFIKTNIHACTHTQEKQNT